MEFIVVAILIGIGVALMYGAGAAINNAINKPIKSESIQVPNPHCETVKQHQSEAVRLIKESLSPDTKENPVQLKKLAYHHFIAADILENGPYKM